jgi:hypothetical protein
VLPNFDPSERLANRGLQGVQALVEAGAGLAQVVVGDCLVLVLDLYPPPLGCTGILPDSRWRQQAICVAGVSSPDLAAVTFSFPCRFALPGYSLHIFGFPSWAASSLPTLTVIGDRQSRRYRSVQTGWGRQALSWQRAAFPVWTHHPDSGRSSLSFLLHNSHIGYPHGQSTRDQSQTGFARRACGAGPGGAAAARGRHG